MRERGDWAELRRSPIEGGPTVATEQTQRLDLREVEEE